jgi:hypothetical protein
MNILMKSTRAGGGPSAAGPNPCPGGTQLVGLLVLTAAGKADQPGALRRQRRPEDAGRTLLRNALVLQELRVVFPKGRYAWQMTQMEKIKGWVVNKSVTSGYA